MYATINLPGSSYFQYYGPAAKPECQDWLASKKQEFQQAYGGAWFSAYSPFNIVPNKTAKRWKYRDGTKVVRA